MKSNQRVLSIFDILGPIMIGPSSNHTGGANRIGQIARMILGEEPTHVNFYFYGSMAETYKGHMTDSAVIAGLLGMEVDDVRIRESLSIADKKNIKTKVFLQTLSDKNPNTIELRLKSNSFSIKIVAISIGGGEIIVSSIDEFEVNFSGNKNMVLVILDNDKPENLLKISSMLKKNIIESYGNVTKVCMFL